MIKVGKYRQRGATMIEILVTVLILAVGLLGLAAMQVVSLKNVNNTQFRTLATMYAYDMSERMRSNQAGVEGGGYDDITGIEANPGCSSCNASQVAQLDAFEWNQLIKQDANSGGLPEGVGTVTADGNLFDITVSWKEQSRDTGEGAVTDESFTLTVQM